MLQDLERQLGQENGYPSPGSAAGYPIGEEQSDHVVDPYRSAYSQQPLQQQQQHQHSGFSPYLGSPSNPYEDMNQTTFSSRYSQASSNGLSGGGQGQQQYPMRTLQSQDSNQALLLHQQQQQRHLQSDMDQDNHSFAGGRTQQSSAIHQLSSTESAMSQRAKNEKDEDEADENAEILNRLSRSNSRTQNSKDGGDGKEGGFFSRKKRNKGIAAAHRASSEDSEEEGQERGALRQREKKRCGCCSRRSCVYITFFALICLAIIMYFIVPRSPGFSYVSVSPKGPPVIYSNQIQEPFSMQIRVDSSDNYLPMWLKIDQSKIGHNKGLQSSFTIEPKTIQVISVPMLLDYKTLKLDTYADGTLQTLIRACQVVDPNSGMSNEGINLTVGGKLKVWGLSWVWKPEFSFNVDNVPCPVNARDPNTPDLPPASPPPSPSPSATTTGSALPSSTGSPSASASSTNGGGGAQSTTTTTPRPSST
ncbi:hypothetical protein BG011_003322 [Mortierella polycephala]|uniref:Uncharacterized protein n=1 Tax=Mortierella polycephala TaxID=41804 RepID=A0A9P6U472_9FUNG|nr:hypothetical protein BG011_003322 [Mortierella polycephala]